jgi:hypothetical protein
MLGVTANPTMTPADKAIRKVAERMGRAGTNLGVNPSLTITAQAERAMAMWPNRGEPDPGPCSAHRSGACPPWPPASRRFPADPPAALRFTYDLR